MNSLSRATQAGYEGTAKVLYGIVAVLWPLFVVAGWSLWFAHRPWRSGMDFLHMLLWPVLAALLILLPAARAWWRVTRGGFLMPWWQLRAHPVTAGLMFSTAIVCVAFPVLVQVALVDFLEVRYGSAHPATYFWWPGFALAAITLVLGECVLIGRDTSTQTPGRIS